ncbi:MAG: hypothetical protein RSE53_08820, partial [Oscillospiraceae bacterium]
MSTANARCTGDFKQQVLEDIQESKLSQHQESSKYEVQQSVIMRRKRIYQEEGAQDMYIGGGEGVPVRGADAVRPTGSSQASERLSAPFS